MAIGDLYREVQDRTSLCLKIRSKMESKGWRYVVGNFEFIKEDKSAKVHLNCITFTFSGSDGSRKYSRTHHKLNN